MSSPYLIDLEFSDDTSRIVRKCNHNFRTIGSNITLSTDGKIQEAQEENNERFDGIDNNIESLDKSVKELIANLRSEINDLRKDIVDRTTPHVGTVVIYDDPSIDPNKIYTGTTWTRIDGYFLRSSSASGSGGDDTRTLSIENIPSHNHAVSLTSSEHGGHLHHISISGNTDTTYSVGFLPQNSNGYFDNIDGHRAHPVNVSHYEARDYDRIVPSIGEFKNIEDVVVNLWQWVGRAGEHSHTVSGSTNNKGGNSSGSTIGFNNMPKYMNVCAWKRTK